jgi:hypothetical protein
VGGSGAVPKGRREKKKRLSKNQIDIIKHFAPDPKKPPFAVYTISPVAGPLSSRRLDPRDITTSFVNDDTNGLDRFPGGTPPERAACLNELIIAWTAAREKVRAWASEGMSFTAILEQHPEWGDLMPYECDVSQVDPWRICSPPPWRVDRPASVVLHWTSTPSSGGVKFGTWIFQMQRELRAPSTDRDEIILCENGVDTREFFRIDVGDRETWAKAELEKTEREFEENERIVRRAGLEGADSVTIIAMERSFETLAPREKEGIKAMQKCNGLAWRRAKLKNQFGV